MARHRRRPSAVPGSVPFAVDPAWAGRPWGAVRGAVLALAALTAIAFWAFEPLSGPDRVFWLIVGLGAGAAGLASSSRIAGLSPESVVARERVKSMTADAAARAARAARARRPGEGSSWGDVAGVLVPRTIGDAAVATLVTTVGMAVWVAMRVVDGGWTAGLVSSLITTPIATFVVFVSLLVVGWLLVFAARGFALLRRTPRGEAPASAWWVFGAIAAGALAAVATLAVGLTDTTPVTGDGGEALVAFLFGAVSFDQAWQAVALWAARLGILALAVCLIGVFVARARARR
ncbi:hypothetical protein [Microbacterium aurum]|uniref:hypothetical protein n=1 Tax=Microbacterium aurum TaxID=36805 RepID=UPI00248EB054|nr:hypothetical protein [Microbacterium aurum]